MVRYQRVLIFACAVILAAGSAAAQQLSTDRPKGVVNFLTPINPDPVLQHDKEIYVSYGCAYCHGVFLQNRGEAADLLHSSLVGKDNNGDYIGAVLRVGIPQTAKLSPMPQFSDLSDREISDIVDWIHYERQQEKYKELTAARGVEPGNAAAGKTYFSANCGSCHNDSAAAALGKKYDASALQTHILRPAFLDVPQTMKVSDLQSAKASEAARHSHLHLLENYSPADVANLTAYLQSLK